jgi:DNA-directed RNA polymerase specialized sigma24 family protein
MKMLTKTQRKQYETLWAFMEAQKGLIYRMITEVLNYYGLFDWEKADIYQELAVSLVKLTPGKEWRTIKNKIRSIVRQRLTEMERIEIYLEQELANNDGEFVGAYIDKIKVDNLFDAIEDDTVEEIKGFMELFGAEYRAVIKYLLLGYNRYEIAHRLKKSVSEISNIISNVRLVASIYFNVDRRGVEYTFD